MRFNQVVRRLAKMPLFTAASTLTLAIGIGANTAIFSVIEGVLLKPLPYPRPDELVVLDHAAEGLNLPHIDAAPFQFFTYRDDGHAFRDVGLWSGGTVSVTGLAEPEEVPTVFVTDGVLPILGVQPMIGRPFSKADDSPDAPATVILTAGYWRSRFGSDASAVGRTMLLDGVAREIIGILPDSFRFLDRKVSLLLPERLDRSKVFLGNFSYHGIARLKPGVSIEQANADVARMIPVSLTRFPAFGGLSVKTFEEAHLAPRVRSLKTDLVGDVRTVLWVLMGMIGMVLLIACANVANLLLVRAESRQQELAIRAALGAGSGRIARELLVESLALALLGGIAGLGLAVAALRVIVALAPGNLPRMDAIAIDGPVLLFTVALSCAAGLLFGAIPIFKYTGPRIGSALRGGGRTASASRERHRSRNALVIVQVALALVLLVSSGLMIRTFQALRNVQPGFTRPEQVETFRLSIPDTQVKDDTAVVRMHQAILEKLGAVPGVASAALTSYVPMSGGTWHDPLYAQDRSYSESRIPPLRMFKFITPGFTRTIGGSMVAGRDFTWEDLYDRRPVVILSENLARELWGAPSAAIGKKVRPYAKGEWREVVGVVGDMHDDGVNEKAPSTAYWPMLMNDFDPSPDSHGFVRRSMSYIVRSSRTGSAGFAGELARAVWSVNPNLPLANTRTLQEVYDRSLARTSFTLVLLAIAGVMALVLGVAGVYGVIACSVSQRTREIGIRVALGARGEEVTRMFVRHGLALAAVGIAIGLTAALAAARLMSSLLFEVRPADPPTFAAVALVLVAATALASYVPALRATSVDPVQALRAE